VELRSPVKFEKAPKVQSRETVSLTKTEDQEALGNRGYITQSETAPILEPSAANIEKYKVLKGDTLQKISKKFYGTTKKWNKIFEANRNILKGPNKVYPGQVIDIPVDPLKETKENLK
jgi:nucleoid-associated protein YgaU